MRLGAVVFSIQLEFSEGTDTPLPDCIILVPSAGN